MTNSQSKASPRESLNSPQQNQPSTTSNVFSGNTVSDQPEGSTNSFINCGGDDFTEVVMTPERSNKRKSETHDPNELSSKRSKAAADDSTKENSAERVRASRFTNNSQYVNQGVRQEGGSSSAPDQNSRASNAFKFGTDPKQNAKGCDMNDDGSSDESEEETKRKKKGSNTSPKKDAHSRRTGFNDQHEEEESRHHNDAKKQRSSFNGHGSERPSSFANERNSMSDGEKRDDRHNHAIIPIEIYRLIPSQELELLNMRMTAKGYDAPDWPINIFAKLYLKDGCHATIRRYCDRELTAIEERIELRLKAKKKDHSHGQFNLSSSDDSEDEKQRKKLQQERLQRERSVWRRTQAWNEDQPDNKGAVCDVHAIFTEISERESVRLLQSIPPYDMASTEEVRDWCTWVAKYEVSWSTYTTYRANYILLSKAGPRFIRPLLSVLKFQLTKIPTKKLARRIGRIVYELRGSPDPVAIAAKLKRGQMGCTTYRDLLERVVELHYCRSSVIPSDVWVMNLFAGIYCKMPEYERSTFKIDVFLRYPSLRLKLHRLGESGTLLGSLKSSEDKMTGFPVTEQEIAEYSEFLVDVASIASFISVEKEMVQFSGYPDDPKYGINKWARQQKSKDNDKKSTALKTSVATFDKAKAGVPKKPHPMEQQTQPATEPTENNKESTPSRFKQCTHCKKKGHLESECFQLHPDLQEQYNKRKEEQKKGKRSASRKRKSADSSAITTASVQQSSSSSESTNSTPTSVEGGF